LSRGRQVDPGADPSPSSCASRTVALALIFASMLARNPALTITQTRTDPKSARRPPEQVDAITFKSFMESPVSSDGALTELTSALTNKLQPTSQCLKNISLCGLSAPRRKQ
jgi:hypothetical protein